MSSQEDMDKAFQDALRRQSKGGMGISVGGVQAFAEMGEYVESKTAEGFNAALRRGTGAMPANDASAFAETNEKVASSNNPQYLAEQTEAARRRFGGK